MAKKTHKICTSKELCQLKGLDKYGSHCNLSKESKCEYQGCSKTIFSTEEQALDSIVKECKK